MKNSKGLKTLMLFLAVISILYCKNDLNITDKLIGEWQRSDFNDEFEYKLVFQSDNSGFRTQREGNLIGPTISNAVSFKWIANGSALTLTFDTEVLTTSFSINSNEQLLLSDLTDLYFIKLD